MTDEAKAKIREALENMIDEAQENISRDDWMRGTTEHNNARMAQRDKDMMNARATLALCDEQPAMTDPSSDVDARELAERIRVDCISSNPNNHRLNYQYANESAAAIITEAMERVRRACAELVRNMDVADLKLSPKESRGFMVARDLAIAAILAQPKEKP